MRLYEYHITRSLLANATNCGRQVSEPEAVFNLAGLRAREVEIFVVLCLNAKNGVLAWHEVTSGLADRTQVHPREVFRLAVLTGASRVLLLHNHPSGDPTPSAQDIAATRQLVEAGNIIGIEVLDHVVVGGVAPTLGRRFVSFRQENLM